MQTYTPKVVLVGLAHATKSHLELILYYIQSSGYQYGEPQRLHSYAEFLLYAIQRAVRTNPPQIAVSSIKALKLTSIKPTFVHRTDD